MKYEVDYFDVDGKTRIAKVDADIEPNIKPEDSKVIFKAVKKQNRHCSKIRQVKPL
jgi:hypothetical protein